MGFKEVKSENFNHNLFKKSRRGQVTIFIIIAIVIIALASLFFIFKDKLIGNRLPAEIAPIHNTLISCLEGNMETGIYLLESQGGYIYLPGFEAGSDYMPFSSQLNFMGNYIPYWYYVSGNGVQKEQVPSKSEMERSLGEFIESKISSCIFEEYYGQGYEISIGKPTADINIQNKRVALNLKMNFDISKGDKTTLIKNHEVLLDSRLGTLYNSALEVYEKEQDSLFLENYSVDILRMYAPVDGIELTCSPKVWEANSVFNDLQDAIEANTLALKNKGGSEDYFALNFPIEEDVQFLNSKNWPNSFEVLPSEENFLIAKPVGTQAGLGILGFCYVPYHFVYNIKYPVLIQIISGGEIFQFPFAVVILGNKPREPLKGSAIGAEFSELCNNKNTLTSVILYDNDLRKINGNISYECFGTSCFIGESEGGILYDKFPQCVNGYIIVRAEGYRGEKAMHSTTIAGSSISIVLDKIYEIGVNLKLGGKAYNGEATISFVSDDFSKTIVYPQEKKVKLSEGDYEIRVSIYKNSSLSLGKNKMQQCIEVPKGGFGGLIGLTEKECFDVEYPAQIISSALAGGGKQNYSISEYELKNSNLIEINAEGLPAPTSFEQLQENYILFETKSLGINFR